MQGRLSSVLTRGRLWWGAQNRAVLPLLFAESSPLDLRIVGRTLLHASLVGVATGLVGAAFFGALEYAQRYLLEYLTGYVPLRAHGETFAAGSGEHVFRPWLLVLLPALGGLLCGLVTRLAPEARGGGGDAMIHAFHHDGGIIRRRVIGVKFLASMLTLGTGGAGGREGPTMQIGGGIGSYVGRLLRVGPRETRILMVAGVGAGMSAVFRTPLGAALLAVEVLYADGFESDALIPSVLASVVSYSVVISIFGESTLLAHAPRFPFSAIHLPLYALLAVLVALLAAAFAGALHRSHVWFDRIPCPDWLRPSIGGFLLGALATALVLAVGRHMSTEGQGLGLLGGGYGAVQVAISGASWIPSGWTAVELLFGLSIVKIVAASLTIGSGGSAGDFAPSLCIGGLFGGAFGRAVALLTHDPSIDPGAFALVGMGAFYGGIAHVPLSALVLVCELAGNYDLLVPLMLTQGIVFVALRGRTLYDAQVPALNDSPVHRDTLLQDLLKSKTAADLMTRGRPYASFQPETTAAEMLRLVAESTWQDVFPVVDASQRMVGLVSNSVIPILAMERDGAKWAVAADVMGQPVSVRDSDDLITVTELLLKTKLRELPVVDVDSRIVGFLDEAEIAAIYFHAASHPE
jgi:CIC family chloride channel protein